MNKKLYRSNKNKMVGGVAGGLAEYFDIDPTIVRVVFVVALLMHGIGILAYILLWVIVPEQPFVFNMPAGSAAGSNEPQPIYNAGQTENTSSHSEVNSENNFAKAYDIHQQEKKKKRSTFFGAALIIIGAIFLADTWIPHIHFSHLFPIILIGIGIGLIIKSK